MCIFLDPVGLDSSLDTWLGFRPRSARCRVILERHKFLRPSGCRQPKLQVCCRYTGVTLWRLSFLTLSPYTDTSLVVCHKQLSFHKRRWFSLGFPQSLSKRSSGFLTLIGLENRGCKFCSRHRLFWQIHRVFVTSYYAHKRHSANSVTP